MRSYRFAGHAAVLVIAMAMWTYGASNLTASLRSQPGAVNAEAANVGDVVLNRDSTIVKPVSIPIAPLPNHKPLAYKIQQDDTLQGISAKFGVSLRDLIWSNPGLKLPLKAGKALWLPPVPGVVVTVRKGDSPSSLAAAYGTDVPTVLGFNRIRASELAPGMALVIPIDPQVGPSLVTGVPADPMAPGALICPIKGAKIIQGFGPTGFSLEPSYDGYLHFHSGVDLLAEYGTRIDAAAGGRVSAVGLADYFGLRVEVTDSYGLVEIYAHMSEISVSVGQSIQQGTAVGLVGSTGLSIGSHLHFQLDIGGAPQDPLPLIGC